MLMAAFVVTMLRIFVVTAISFGACLGLKSQPRIQILIGRLTVILALGILFTSPITYHESKPIVPLKAIVFDPAVIQMTNEGDPLAQIDGNPVANIPAKVDRSASTKLATSTPIAQFKKTITKNAGKEAMNAEYWFFGYWFLGVGLLAAGLVAGSINLRLLKKRTKPQSASAVTKIALEASNYFNISVPNLAEGKSIRSPFVAGLIKPTVYLPIGWVETVDEESLRAVIFHEVAHLASRDLFWRGLHRLACCLLWPQYLLWKMGSMMALASEKISDESVVLSGIPRESYAETLLSIQKTFPYQRMVSNAIGVVSTKSKLGIRIESVLQKDDLRWKKVSGALVAVALFGGAFASVLGFRLFGISLPNVDYNPGFFSNLPVCPRAIHLKVLGRDGHLLETGKAYISAQMRDGTFEVANASFKDGFITGKIPNSLDVFVLSVIAEGPNHQLTFDQIYPRQIPLTELKFRPTTKLVGLVTSHGQQKPMGGIRVYPTQLSGAENKYYGLTMLPPQLEKDFTSETLANGTFSISGLPRNCGVQIDTVDPASFAMRNQVLTGKQIGLKSSVPLWISAPGMQFQLKDLAVNHTNLAISMMRAGIAWGYVMQNQHSVAGVDVMAHGTGGLSDSYVGWDHCSTNSKGRYALLCPKGMVNVEIAPAKMDSFISFKPFRLIHIVPPTVAKSLFNVPITAQYLTGPHNLQLTIGAMVKGLVLNKTSDPLSGLMVNITDIHHTEYRLVEMTDQKGRFEFRVPPGEYQVEVALLNGKFKRDQQVITVASSQVKTLQFREDWQALGS